MARLIKDFPEEYLAILNTALERKVELYLDSPQAVRALQLQINLFKRALAEQEYWQADKYISITTQRNGNTLVVTTQDRLLAGALSNVDLKQEPTEDELEAYMKALGETENDQES